MKAPDMSGIRRHRRAGSHWRALLYIGAAVTGIAVWATPQPSLAAGQSTALLRLASAGLTDAEMAQETGTGIDASVAVPNIASPQPKVILWDELHHPSQLGMQADSATVTIRLLP